MAPRPGHAQTFEIDLANPSSVSQTVLGLTDGAYLGNPHLVAEPEHITVSTTPVFPEPPTVHYTSKPVTIPPHREYSVRVTILTADYWEGCRAEYWTDLSLQVKVGIFTRTEDVDFDRLILQLQEPRRNCVVTGNG